MTGRSLYFAFTHSGHVMVIPADPGPAHALDVVRTKEGHPWIGANGLPLVPPHHPHVYDGRSGPSALCGATVRVVVPAPFNAEDEDACPACARHANEGSFRRLRPAEHDRCGDSLKADAEDGGFFNCDLHVKHRGPHHDQRRRVQWDDESSNYFPGAGGQV